MSFLTPLYLLGALAVSLPILFHMIRRTPRDRQEFSSTMFLQPSPPRITRRSRIEHWLLLLLRALAVCLLALAFARPFFRESEQQALADGDGRAVVVLIDTSASMRRDGLWDEAAQRLDEFLRSDTGPADQVAVLAFDDRPQTVCSFDQWAAIDHAQRAEAVKASMEDVSASWNPTNLGAALVEAAEQLDAMTTQQGIAVERMVVVISDLQEGAKLTSLQSYDWPKGVAVKLVPVGDETSPNNAGIHLVSDSSVPAGDGQRRTRVRVTNTAGADRDEFQIRWTDEFDTPAGSAEAAKDDMSVSVIVPQGQTRIVRAAARPDGPGTGRLVLSGDEQEFDNVCFVPPLRPRSATVALLGEAATGNDPQGMRFYLPAALTSLPQRRITVVEWTDLTTDPSTAPPQLLIATEGLPDDSLESVRHYVTDGGTLLFAAAISEGLAGIYSLLDVAPAAVTEADVEDYAMLTSMDFDHPLFSPLADPRFSDFTRIRIWQHRTLFVDSLADANVLARFDDGDAAVIETALGEGRIIIFTFGWHPVDSQLAVSTKFVPMLNGLVDDVAGIVERRTTYLVGETVLLAEFKLTPADIEAVRTPAGERIAIDADAKEFSETDVPGVYRFLLREATSDDPPAFAVNLEPSESRTARITDDMLLAAGVRLSAEASERVIDEAAQRQLRAGELEDRQKLWRWIVVAVIVLLVAETLLASRAARRQLVYS